MQFNIHEFSGGLRLIHLPHRFRVAHCGIIIYTGSRDEEAHEHGLAHFIEHTLFKGTQKRNAFQVLCRLEDVGGELNAYTTEEYTCIYASFLSVYYQRTMELLSDIFFHSIFPAAELQKEKSVILDEISLYQDSPSELIFDDFDELLFGKSSLGRNILGQKKTLASFNKAMIKKFIGRNYHSRNVVISSVGNIAFPEITVLVKKHFSSIAVLNGEAKKHFLKISKPKQKIKHKDTHQAHIMLGTTAYSIHHRKRSILNLLNNILGGPGMNSRLNVLLREKNGIAYNIGSYYSPYRDTGTFTIYFGTDKQKIQYSLSLIKKLLHEMKTKKMTATQLHNAQRQYTGQIAIAAENKEALMLGIGKSMLVFNRAFSYQDIYKEIHAITFSALLDTANEIFDDNRFSQLIYV